MPDNLHKLSSRDIRTTQGTRRFDSHLLFGDARHLEIVHKGVVYRLQVTRQDKLILTK